MSGSFKERKITIERCSASAREEYAYDIFAEMQLQMDQSQANGKGILFKTSLEKSLFSSPVACIKSIEARIKKLEKKYTETDMPDITRLKELKSALEMITPSDFSRYTKLLELLRSIEYGWTPAKNNDRLVIFTERIETMKYLAENLKRDMKLADNQLEVMYGGMSDKELQRIVDEFGRAESPIRVIVASDVASEGINLHYLSHRLIHFDIPWSLMVFQQRNGRIDRYGQHEQPDIRYMLIDSENPKIKGDARIMEILVQKEEQALKNIGDPAMLFGKFNQEEEEEETAKAIENGVGEAFADQLDAGEEEFDPLELLMGLGEEDTVKIEYSDEETLFSDLDYVKNALDVFTDTEEIKYADLTATQGVEIKLTDNVKKKISKLMPPEAMPSDDYLRLSPDKVYCMKDMSRCMQNELAETAWPATQYLWKLHPIFNWIEDKAGVFYKRNEIPVLGLSNGLRANEIVYIIAGTIPNRKSTTVVDEWFGVYYKDNKFVQIFTMSEVMQKTHLNEKEPNTQRIMEQQIVNAQALLQDVVERAKSLMFTKCVEYKDKTDPYIYDEMQRLMELQERHKDAQLSIFDLGVAGMERRKSEKEREIEKIFDDFMEWEKDTLEIEENPYIRIIAVTMGVN